jgi:hypothetical protein
MLRPISLVAGALVLAPAVMLSGQNAPEETVRRAELPGSGMTLVLPTDNDALLRGKPEGFYMFVDRTFENELTTPWEGGAYGYVRGPVRVGRTMQLMHFHEGVDIAPLKRDASGEPQDEVRSISQGEVVHCSDAPGASNYGRYVVIRHDWGQGPFFSLYAHLSKITVKEGEKVKPGAPVAIMGHTGEGIDRRRAHTHLELNLFLNSRFTEWHDANFKGSPNKHGNYNGLNLAGLDISALYLARQKNPSLTAAEFVAAQDAAFKVLVPRKGELELLRNYPWLGVAAPAPSPSWELSFNGGGLPLRIRPAAEIVSGPKASWVKDEGVPASYHTRGYLSGSAAKFALTSSGLRYVQLITGEFPAAKK